MFVGYEGQKRGKRTLSEKTMWRDAYSEGDRRRVRRGLLSTGDAGDRNGDEG